MIEPTAGFGQRLRIEPADVSPASHRPYYDTGRLKHLDMFGYSRERNIKRLGKLRHGMIPGGEALDDRAPGRIGDSAEDDVELIKRGVHNSKVCTHHEGVNRLVEYVSGRQEGRIKYGEVVRPAGDARAVGRAGGRRRPGAPR